MCQDEVGLNGWTSVPANAGAIFNDRRLIKEAEPLSLDQIPFPHDDPAVAKTLDYVKRVLHPETLSHSMRVYYYGMAITKLHFPDTFVKLNPSTWALTTLLHDLGTAEENLTGTRMSFDIYGGIKALQVSKDFGASSDQAEAVAEAIIRHEDMGVDGTITYIGQLIQLATTYDNTSVHPHVRNFENMVHPATREEVVKAHPRLLWSEFFARTIRKEESIKPWCHSIHLVNFAEEIENNTLMKKWE
ncbi:unnamed protein product [Penicillium egyptiacum]|uniref:HD domain-containing protein n=1 Tax=Penicillium egyptiacum TaxID=1303716 RepID=A0A9W4KIK8_9EURO|nr:unnamed protein product [Penicillium egyptiacum]